jgi:toxin YoeB
MQLVFDNNAVEDLIYWVKNDKKLALRILELINEISKNPYTGKGKPEPLKYNLKNCWSRRINQEHRIIYKVESKALIVLACRYHY